MEQYPNLEDTLYDAPDNELVPLFDTSNGFYEGGDGGLTLDEDYFSKQIQAEDEELRRSIFADTSEPIRMSNNPTLANEYNNTMNNQSNVYIQQEEVNKQKVEDKQYQYLGVDPTVGMAEDNIKRVQEAVGTTADGAWGKGSQLAYDEYVSNNTDGSRVFASGKYQLIPDTLREAVKSGYVKSSDKWGAETQEKAMDYLLESKRSEIHKYIYGSGSKEAAVLALAKEWASFPTPIATDKAKVGESYYGGANKSGTTLEDVRLTLENAKVAEDDAGIRKLIAIHESGKAGYNAYNQGTKNNKIVAGKSQYDFSNFSIGSVLKASNNKHN